MDKERVLKRFKEAYLTLQRYDQENKNQDLNIPQYPLSKEQIELDRIFNGADYFYARILGYGKMIAKNPESFKLKKSELEDMMLKAGEIKEKIDFIKELLEDFAGDCIFHIPPKKIKGITKTKEVRRYLYSRRI